MGKSCGTVWAGADRLSYPFLSVPIRLSYPSSLAGSAKRGIAASFSERSPSSCIASNRSRTDSACATRSCAQRLPSQVAFDQSAGGGRSSLALLFHDHLQVLDIIPVTRAIGKFLHRDQGGNRNKAYEHPAGELRLQARMNQFYERFEAALRQALRAPGSEGGQKPSEAEISAYAGFLTRYLIGCLHQYAKSGFTEKPTESYAAQRRHLAA
ncbi:MAG: hypothetical protein WAO95_18095 [Burkholderiales bacterium]